MVSRNCAVLALFLAMSVAVSARGAEADNAQPKLECEDETAYVPERQEALYAISTTSMAITGDIKFSSTKVEFENGVTADLRYLGNVRKAYANEGGAFFHMQCVAAYAFTSSEVASLLQGNTLCGEPVAYLLAGEQIQKGTISFAIYSPGPSQILLSPLKGELCGTFSYARPK